MKNLLLPPFTAKCAIFGFQLRCDCTVLCDALTPEQQMNHHPLNVSVTLNEMQILWADSTARVSLLIMNMEYEIHLDVHINHRQKHYY